MTHSFEFERLDLAMEARQIASAWLADSDDRRRTLVEVSEDMPTDVRELLAWRAYRAMPKRRYGQVPLTERERTRIDFRATNVFHARSCKALATALSVSDWLSWYDVSLTVDEHFDVFESAREDVPKWVVPAFVRGPA
jgi:hypothetical protein